MKAILLTGLVAITLAFSGCCHKVEVFDNGTCTKEGCCKCPKGCDCANGHCTCKHAGPCKGCDHCNKK